MIESLRPTAGTSERQSYASAMAGLWRDLARVLRRLEGIALRPEIELADPTVVETLPVLQYGLHTAGELVLGLDPPAGTEAVHRELAEALEDARDATAEVGEAVWNGGAEAAAPLVPEWRGALFQVRLAQMRLSRAPRAEPAQAATVEDTIDRAALLATCLVLAGAVAVTGGAVLGLWPVWVVGLVLVAGGFLACSP
jgi:hypothetical protein